MIKLSKKLENRMRIQNSKFEKYTDDHIPNVNYKEVNHHLHGHMEILSAHTAIRVSDVLDGSTYDKDSKFPEINHLFELPKENFDMITIPTKEIEDLINPKNIENGSHMNVLELSIDENTLTIQPIHRSNSLTDEIYEYDELTLPLTNNSDTQISFMVNPTYFFDAMNFFRMLGITEVTLLTEINHKPIHLLSDNIQYVIAKITKK